MIFLSKAHTPTKNGNMGATLLIQTLAQKAEMLHIQQKSIRNPCGEYFELLNGFPSLNNY